LAKIEAVSDFTLAGSYFDAFSAPDLIASGVSGEKLNILREEYVDAAVYNKETILEIRKAFGV